MPRPLRKAESGTVYHVLNRGNARCQIFDSAGDYAAFESVLCEGRRDRDIELLAYCLMPNHWHLVLRPLTDRSLSNYMAWITMTHAQRWHAFRGTAGTGHVYQGRYKSFPVQSDGHFLTLCRYVETNALRAHLVQRAEHWRWCSLWLRLHHTLLGRNLLSTWPVQRPREWLEIINTSAQDTTEIRECIARGRPLGSPSWKAATVRRLGLESTTRRTGRPTKLSILRAHRLACK